MEQKNNEDIETMMIESGVLTRAKGYHGPIYEAPARNHQNKQEKQQLSEQGQQAKRELEILAATGRAKELTGKALTFNDVNYMNEQNLLKYYGIYQSAVAVRVNDSFSKIAVKTYAKLTSSLLPIKDDEKLYEDLRNDYILMSELEKWIGFACFKMGSFTALASAALITVGNYDFNVINEPRDESGEATGATGDDRNDA